MKILYIVKRAGIGGVQTFTKTLIDYLKSERIECHIFFALPDFYEDNNSFKDYSIYNTINNPLLLKIVNKADSILYKLGIRKGIKTWWRKHYFNRLLSKNHYSLIHLNTDTVDDLLSTAKKFDLPIVLTLHGIYKNLYFSKQNQVFEEERIRKLDKHINLYTYFTEDNLVDFKIALGEKKVLNSQKFIRTNNPYLKKELSKGDPSEKLKFGLFGRGFESKGWEIAFNAFKEVHRQRGNCELHFYGKGEFLESFVQKNSHADFFFHGHTFDPISKMKDISVGLIPSFHEEMPYVIIEFLSLGIPVIAAKTGAIPEMIKTNHNENAGFILNLKEGRPNSNELASMMIRYIDDQGLLSKHSINAINAFQKFDVNEVGRTYLNIYKSIDREHTASN